MSLEGRIRNGLGADASGLEPGVDPALRTLLERGPRHRAARTAARSVALAVVVSVFVLGGLAALRSIGRDGGDAAGRGPVSSVSPIDGGWRMTLSIEDGLRAGFGYGRAGQLAGSRQLELSLGVVRQIRPGSFQTVPVNGTFRVDGPFLIIQDDGETLVFRWTLSGNELNLSLVGDSRPAGGAAVDRLIWTTRPWEWIG
jgi:hypothetical protein